GLPLYVIGSATQPPLPPGTNRTTLLTYTSVPVTKASVDGKDVPVRTEYTAGRWMTQLLIDLAPGAQSVVVLHASGTLPAPKAPHPLSVVPGGGVQPDHYEVHVARRGRSGRTGRTVAEASGDLRAPLSVG